MQTVRSRPWPRHLMLLGCSVLVVVGGLGCAKSANDLYKDGLAELESGNVELAQERFEAAVQKDPSLVAAYRHLARIYEVKNQPDRAVPMLEKWVQHEPFSALPRVQLARYYLRLGRFEDSRAIYEDLAASAASEQERKAYEQTLAIILRARERQERIAELKGQLDEHPGDPKLTWELGSLYLKIGQNFTFAGKQEMGRSFMEQSWTLLEQARDVYERQVEDEGDVAKASIQLASVYYDIGQHHLFKRDTEGALKAFRKANELHPDESKYPFVLAQLYGRDKRLEEAIDALRRAIALEPANALYHGALGNTLASNQQLAEAEAALREADRLSPNSGEYLFKLARLYDQEKKDASDIITLLQQALEKEPENPQYRFSLSGFLEQNGNHEESVAQLQEVIRIGAGTDWEERARKMIEQLEQRRAPQSEE